MQRLRMTHQRELLLEELKRNRNHPTAEELYAIVRRRAPHISLATVYRNLETLSGLGLVRKLEIRGRQKRFDGNPAPHDHITCTECRRIDDIFPEPGAETVCDLPHNGRLGYQVSGRTVEYYGICPECQHKLQQAKEERAARPSPSAACLI